MKARVESGLRGKAAGHGGVAARADLHTILERDRYRVRRKQVLRRRKHYHPNRVAAKDTQLIKRAGTTRFLAPDIEPRGRAARGFKAILGKASSTIRRLFSRRGGEA